MTGLKYFPVVKNHRCFHLKAKDRYEYQCPIEEQPRFCFCNSIIYRKIDTKKIQRRLLCRKYLFGYPVKAELLLVDSFFGRQFWMNFIRSFYHRVTTFSSAQAFLPGSSITMTSAHCNQRRIEFVNC